MKAVCPYCQQPAELVQGKQVYPRAFELAQLWFWKCTPCDAWVGTHRNSNRHAPLGTLANEELRLLRQRVHAAFDPIWQRSGNRRKVYEWLAQQMGIDLKDCHIAKFDEVQCVMVIEICKTRI